MNTNNFIGVFNNALPPTLCQRLIELFESYDSNHVQGHARIRNEPRIDKEVKDSTDLPIDVDSDHPDIRMMLRMLDVCIDLYMEKFTFLKEGDAFVIHETFNIQRYLPGQGYKSWHCENQGVDPTNNRCLAWMFYLNDVPDGGTEFNYDLSNCEAKEGTCAIWPAYWTHHHRGIVSNTTTKYIVTGWYEYIDRKRVEEIRGSAGGGVKDEGSKV